MSKNHSSEVDEQMKEIRHIHLDDPYLCKQMSNDCTYTVWMLCYLCDQTASDTCTHVGKSRVLLEDSEIKKT